jgi:hypothetical protein
MNFARKKKRSFPVIFLAEEEEVRYYGKIKDSMLYLRQD